MSYNYYIEEWNLTLRFVFYRFLGQNTFSAYKQAQVSSVKIISRNKSESPIVETKI